MTSFISEAKNLAAFVGFCTVANEINELMSYKPLQQLFNRRKYFF